MTAVYCVGPEERFRSDAEAACHVAALLEVSEYRLFEVAYQKWFGAAPEKETLEREFGEYLERGTVPFWLRNLVRNVLAEAGRGAVDPASLGVVRRQGSAAERRIGWFLLISMVSLVLAYGWLVIASSHTISAWFVPR